MDATNTDALEALREPFEAYLKEISTVTVETAEQYEAAAFGLKKLKTWESDITAHFEPERKKTHDAYNAVTTAKSSYLTKVTAVEKVIKAKMGDYIKAENERIRISQEEERRQLATMPTPEAPAVVSDVVVPQATKVTGISVTNTWAYKIVEVSEIKKEFWTLNEALILKVVKDLGPAAVASVGGIEVFPDAVIGSRRG